MNVTYSHPDGTLLRHCKETPDQIEDAVMSSAWAGRDESNRMEVRVQNACGVVLLDTSHQTHCAWLRSYSIFGAVRKAYTVAGNLVLQGNKVSFKGAQRQDKLCSVLRELLFGDFTVQLQLMVMAMGIGRCLDVRPGSLLEVRLRRFSWIRVMGRIEEICNLLVFYVTDWRAFEAWVGMRPWEQLPKSTTVSVTRRGTLTVRLTWNGVRWADNRVYEQVTETLAHFVRDLV